MIRVRLARIDINQVEANRLLNSPQGEVADLVVSTGRLVLRAVRRETPVQDGDMKAANAMIVRVRPYRLYMARIINTDEAALWVHNGTGIYGARGRPITPRRARGRGGRPAALQFEGKRDGELLYRRSVKGQPANRFMLRGLIFGTSATRQRWTIVPGGGFGLIGTGP